MIHHTQTINVRIVIEMKIQSIMYIFIFVIRTRL